jgi:hypothetical protein
MNTFTAEHVNYALGRLNTFVAVNRGMEAHEVPNAIMALAQSFGMTAQLCTSIALLIESIWGEDGGAYVLIGMMIGLGMAEAS